MFVFCMLLLRLAPSLDVVLSVASSAFRGAGDASGAAALAVALIWREGDLPRALPLGDPNRFCRTCGIEYQT